MKLNIVSYFLNIINRRVPTLHPSSNRFLAPRNLLSIAFVTASTIRIPYTVYDDTGKHALAAAYLRDNLSSARMCQKVDPFFDEI